jgi:exosome complex RNA-binding protein Csl4
MKKICQLKAEIKKAKKNTITNKGKTSDLTQVKVLPMAKSISSELETMKREIGVLFSEYKKSNAEIENKDNSVK